MMNKSVRTENQVLPLILFLSKSINNVHTLGSTLLSFENFLSDFKNHLRTPGAFNTSLSQATPNEAIQRATF